MDEKSKDRFLCTTLFVVSFIAALCLGFAVWSCNRSGSLRAELDTVRAELEAARGTIEQLNTEVERSRADCEELRNTIGQCNSIIQDITVSARDDVKTIRECVDLVRAIRQKVELLEDYLNSSSSDVSSTDSISNN